MNSHNTVSGQGSTSSKVAVLVCLLATLFFWDVHAGTALRLYYQNIKGDTVADLLSHPGFPASPTSTEVISRQLERIERGGDHWGSWIRGYLEAPHTGKYTFSLASDNNSEFWLSTTHLPFQVNKILENVVTPQNYKVRSESIELVRGIKYYFELYHKEGLDGDHISVAWNLPDGTLEAPIPSHRILPVPVDKSFQTREKAPVFLKHYFGLPVSVVTNMTVAENETVILAATVEGTQPMTFQWFRNEKLIEGENLSSLTLTNRQLSQSGESFLVVASNELGSASVQAIVNVVRDDIAPTVRSALNVGSRDKILVFFSKAIDPGSAAVVSNYELNNGAVVESVNVMSRDTVQLIASPLQAGKSYTVMVRNVKDFPRRNVSSEQKPFTLDQGLILWLQFDTKDEHDIVPDSSGNHNSAVLLNGARLNEGGVSGTCLELDGLDDHAILPSGFENFTNGMTVALWAKPVRVGSWSRFIDFGNGKTGQNIFFTREAKYNHLVFETYGNSKKRAIARDILVQGEWQHLAASMDASGNVSLYKDGILVRQEPTNIPAVQERTSNLIGRSNWDVDAHYKGFMDDLRVYERALSATEIEMLAIAGRKQIPRE